MSLGIGVVGDRGRFGTMSEFLTGVGSDDFVIAYGDCN